MPTTTLEAVLCYHCGDECKDLTIVTDEHHFCCNGCKTVYEILKDNNLCNYYALDSKAGNQIKEENKKQYEYLNEPKIAEGLYTFKEGGIASLTFYIPSIHCSSCIWLLENLHKINPEIISSTIHFQRKELSLQFNEELLPGDIALLLHKIGYPPILNQSVQEKKKTPKELIYKIGIAGFCFGNIMLLSLPEYLNNFNYFTGDFKKFFSILNLLLALPVFIYCANDYWKQSWNALKTGVINIDLPIGAALLAAFGQSVYEIIAGSGVGFMDSFTGLVFFLLIGKWYQSKTYDAISFERDYKSYFPLAITRITEGKEEYIQLKEIKAGDHLLVRNNEIIPADGKLLHGKGKIDYSFVTGESLPVNKETGDPLYAGGKQTGAAIEIITTREVSESYLTQLWEKNNYKEKTESGLVRFTNTVGKYFTIAILFVAAATFIYWQIANPSVAVFAAVCVLIVFCPCTLSLSLPFCFGNSMAIMGKSGLYLKNTSTIEKLGKVNTIVFDKTGTITHSGNAEITFDGILTDKEKSIVRTLARNSTHPLSKMIYQYFDGYDLQKNLKFSEVTGRGISGTTGEFATRLGSAEFTGFRAIDDQTQFSKVYLSINDKPVGTFRIRYSYRDGVFEIFKKLNKNYDLHLLSGDNDASKIDLKNYFKESNLHFNQSPTSKLEYIKRLQAQGKNVLMIGDGLNDAGALLQSDCGIAVSDDGGSFSPACDGILDGKKMKKLSDFISFSSASVRLVKFSLAISLLYNMTGLFFAVQGMLTPLIAAILMPASSVSVVLFVTIGAKLTARRKRLSEKN